MAEDTRGQMDIRQHQQMWGAFCAITKWGIIGVIVVLVLMAAFLL